MVGPRLDMDTYSLSIAPTAREYEVGTVGTLQVSLTARNGWHVNQDFPTTVTVTAPASLGVQKASLAKGDASTFEEGRFVFPISIKPASEGAGDVRALVSFAICKETQCLPQEEPVLLRVAVH